MRQVVGTYVSMSMWGEMMDSKVDLAKLSQDIYKMLDELNPVTAVGILEGVQFYIQIQTWEDCDEFIATD